MTTSIASGSWRSRASWSGWRSRRTTLLPIMVDVDFRAVTPGRSWESADADTVVDDIVLGTWFAPARGTLEVLALETEPLGTLERVRYRLGAERPDGRFLVEQQAYPEITDGRISSMRIVCSGYLPLQ